MSNASGQVSLAPPGRVTVGIADMAVSADREETIVTFALGSCIGVTVYDPVAGVGGMLHFMLPTGSLNDDKAKRNPSMFADSGIPLLFNRAYELGAKKERMVVCAAGGAEILDDDGHFKIGARNRTILRKIFWKNNVLLAADDTGGNISRTLSLRLSDGRVAVRHLNVERTLWPV